MTATINIKKADLKKALVAMKVKGIKPKSMVALGDDIATEIDFKTPADLWDASGRVSSLKGDEYNVDELLKSLLPDGKK